MVNKQRWWLMAAALATGALSSVTAALLQPAWAQPARLNPARDPNQVPSARYARGEEVDLSLIVEEWRDRYPATPIFACTCSAQSCGDAEIWPFRTFTLYQPFIALGEFNAANNEENGFNCFDMETGARP
ncbi:MAG: hypothetical protein AAFQ74_19150 [Cyanobacteria bacterium J06623_4]